MFSFLSPSKKRMFVLVRLLFRSDFEKRQALLQQHTHTPFFSHTYMGAPKDKKQQQKFCGCGLSHVDFSSKRKGIILREQ
tara:strand:- start:4479 stop:4718 length:240 start_codon:yes stop_codon:yes gene_type:complete